MNAQATQSSRYARGLDRLCARCESPEEALGIAVIGQALRDAGILPSPRVRDPRAPGQARSFLTNVADDWAWSRDLWCSIVGIDPDVLRDFARRQLEPNLSS